MWFYFCTVSGAHKREHVCYVMYTNNYMCIFDWYLDFSRRYLPYVEQTGCKEKYITQCAMPIKSVYCMIAPLICVCVITNRSAVVFAFENIHKHTRTMRIYTQLTYGKGAEWACFFPFLFCFHINASLSVLCPDCFVLLYK